MRQYHDLLRLVLSEGEAKGDRTGVGTLSVFGAQAHYDLGLGFPLVTTKRVHFRLVVGELLWFLRGETNIRSLLADRVTIWSDWPHAKFVAATGESIGIRDFEARILGDGDFAAKWGDLGRVYGAQWRRWRGEDGREHDQLAEVVRSLRENPNDRGIIMSGWNVADLPGMSLRPCHTLYQWGVSPTGTLHCHLYQRSADLLLGVPFNVASAALLTHMLAQVCGLRPGRLVHSFGDLHIYSNHLEQVRTQLAREPRALPRLALNPEVRGIDDFRIGDISLEGYDPHPAIKASVAV